jgi:hypothetical protein
MENNLFVKIFPSPSMVKGGRGSPWARTSGLKGKKKNVCFIGICVNV